MSEKHELIFSLRERIREARRAGEQFDKAASDAHRAMRRADDDLFRVEKVLKHLPAMLEQHCCRPHWKKHYSEIQVRGCTEACTAVFTNLYALRVIDAPENL